MVLQGLKRVQVGFLYSCLRDKGHKAAVYQVWSLRGPFCWGHKLLHKKLVPKHNSFWHLELSASSQREHTDAKRSKLIALIKQLAQIRNLTHLRIFEVIMDWPKGKDLRKSEEEIVIHVKEAPLYNKLLENYNMPCSLMEPVALWESTGDGRLLYRLPITSCRPSPQGSTALQVFSPLILSTWQSWVWATHLFSFGVWESHKHEVLLSRQYTHPQTQLKIFFW